MIPKTYQDLNKMDTNKGMPIHIGINRLSLLRDKGLISEETFSDSKELLLQSEMDISKKKIT